MPCPDYGRVHEGFKLAYPDMGRMHPCFGHAAAMPAAAWWRMCVRDSFEFVRVGNKQAAGCSNVYPYPCHHRSRVINKQLGMMAGRLRLRRRDVFFFDKTGGASPY